MYDAEFHVMASEKDEFNFRIHNFLEYGLYNYNKYKIKILLLLKENPESTLEKDLEKYQKENCDIQVIRFPQDEPSHKKFTYITEILPKHIDDARWFIGIDDDTINDIDRLIDRLDEDFDWEDKYYVSTEPMKNVQPMEYDLALLFGKEHWYCPIGGPYHEWEIFCLSQKAARTIIENENSMKLLNMRKKISKGWGDHCMGVAAKFAKIYPIGTTYISGTHMIAEHTILDGWIVHCHHIYKLPGTNHILPILKARQNNNFGGKKIFLSEVSQDKIEDRGFFALDKKGVMTGPPNFRAVGIWNTHSEKRLDLHFFEEDKVVEFDLTKSDMSKEKKDQKRFRIITA